MTGSFPRNGDSLSFPFTFFYSFLHSAKPTASPRLSPSSVPARTRGRHGATTAALLFPSPNPTSTATDLRPLGHAAAGDAGERAGAAVTARARTKKDGVTDGNADPADGDLRLSSPGLDPRREFDRSSPHLHRLLRRHLRASLRAGPALSSRPPLAPACGLQPPGTRGTNGRSIDAPSDAFAAAKLILLQHEFLLSPAASVFFSNARPRRCWR